MKNIFNKLNFMGRGKGIVVNHKTGRKTGDNSKVKLETNVNRKGMSEGGNLIMDIVDIITDKNSYQKNEIISAYVEEAGSDYHVLVTFGDGTSETKTFSWSYDAERCLRDIQRADGDLTMLRGSCFGMSTVLIKEDAIKRVEQQSRILLKIYFNNNCTITLKYTFKSDCDRDFRNLGGRPSSFEFSFSFNRRNSASRLNDILNNF